MDLETASLTCHWTMSCSGQAAHLKMPAPAQGDAANRSIGSTSGFYNHGEGPTSAFTYRVFFFFGFSQGAVNKLF